MSHDQPVAAQPAGEPTGPILSPAEAGILLRASPESLRRWRNQRTGPRYARIGRRIVYFRSDLLAFA
jgi:hypothetical protein